MLMDEIDVAAATGADGVEVQEAREGRRGPTHEARTFDLPGSIWAIMFLSYGVFFGSLALTVGGTFDALGMVIISVCYTVMFFGTAIVMSRVARNHRPEQGAGAVHSGPVETATGPLGYGAAAAQILTVPILFAFFAICIGLISALTLTG
ncbi:hypothetical protein [Parasphingopyxis lamellibrachiae]|uniref:Uncharacterized protein n=1 Tax=Parasphingopyxis lamellibrachiae TaxID=680125 RepID=A0A3D9FE26_9SPHN|nr:hypothetical protein [Parasphingopyxis lamellibrachiae]RED16003.1 hypothetical protein DFR46_1013 [Parasphingopyxis lamellibrachiae]